MLQNIRDNSQSWIAKTIVGVFIVLLSLTGFDAIISATSTKDDAAEVNGQAIAQRDVARLADQQRQQLARQLGEQFNPDLLDDKALRRAAVEALIQRALLLQASQGAGFAVSDLELDRMLVSMPVFQTEGRFDPVRFDQYLAQMGYTRLQFRQLLREEMLTSQLRVGIADSGFVTDSEVKAYAALERQTRDFASISIEPDAAAISISDQELQDWYEQNASRFMTPEQVVVNYVELKKERFFDQVDVPEDQLQAAYQNAISSISEQRKASHILLETSDGLSDEQARAKLVELRERVLKGEDFAALAREFSVDPGSAASGGDLGFAGRGVWDPAFEDALFALQEGELSQPVKSEFGWHLIRLDGVQAPEIPSLEEMRPQLVREVKEQQVEQRFVEARKQMETLAYESGDLQQVAEEMGLQVQQAAAFGREGGEGLAANRQVLQAAFSEEVLSEGANSGLIELDQETVVVLRVKEHLQPRQQTLAELGDSLRSQLRDQRAAEAARTLGEELVKVLRAGGELPMAQEWKAVEAATRIQEEIDPQILQAVFRLPRNEDGKPVYGSVQLRSGTFLLLRLDGVSDNADALSAEELASFRGFLSSRSGQEELRAFQRQLAVEAEVKYY